MKKLSEKQIADALIANDGKIALTAASLHVTFQCISQRILKSKKLTELRKHLTEIDLDNIEIKLKKACDELKPATIIYYLKSQGKHRGWGEDIEVMENLNESLAAIADRLPK